MKIKDLFKSKKSKLIYSLLIVIAAIVVVIVAVNAKYLKYSNKAENTFSPAVSDNPEIQEQFNKTVKQNVKIKVPDKGYPVYVRAKLVINWQEEGNENGAFYFDPPKENEYELSIGNKWIYNTSDGYYYYTEPVASKGTTEVLITKCELKDGVTPPDGYALSVNILSQTIQAVGHTDSTPNITAVEDAWGVDLS